MQEDQHQIWLISKMTRLCNLYINVTKKFHGGYNMSNVPRIITPNEASKLMHELPIIVINTNFQNCLLRTDKFGGTRILQG